MANENKENFWSKLWKGVVNFFKKGWTLLIVPIGLFIISLFTKSKKGEIKKEIKEKEKEIKEVKKEAEKQEKEVTKKEQEVEKASKEAKETVEEQKQSKQKREAEIVEILPDLKK